MFVFLTEKLNYEINSKRRNGEFVVNGRFITFEGGEGAGKSTVIRHIYEHLKDKGFSVTVTREPGGISIAEKIRGVILDKRNTEMDERTEALLYAAARRQHLVEKIIPSLKNGEVVLCDRFIDSSLAYQGYARGIGLDSIWAINQFAIENVMPFKTIYLDISPEAGLSRVSKDENREVNRLDLENLEFHHKVHEGYHFLLGKYKDRFEFVNAEKSLEEVIADTKEIVDRLTKTWINVSECYE
jgi:dTMP kinase